MAFPHRHSSESRHGAEGPQAAPLPSHASASPRPVSLSPRCHLQGGSPIEGEHQLEKLEFALAVALTRGDQHRSRQLRDQIEALGGNCEEPGT